MPLNTLPPMPIEVTYAESVDVRASIEKVFDYRLDFTNSPAYLPYARNVRRVDGGTELGPGAEFRSELTMPGAATTESYIKVVEVERPNRIVFDVGAADRRGQETSTFTPLPDGGTRVEFSIVIQLPDEAKKNLPAQIERGRKSFRIELDNIRDIFAKRD